MQKKQKTKKQKKKKDDPYFPKKMGRSEKDKQTTLFFRPYHRFSQDL